jgi:hypothetical protein
MTRVKVELKKNIGKFFQDFLTYKRVYTIVIIMVSPRNEEA